MVVEDPQLLDGESLWRDRWFRMLQHSPDAFLEVDRSGVAVAWNARAETEFGWGRDEIIGYPVSETLLPNPAGRPVFDTGAPNGDGAHHRFDVRHRSGRSVAVEGVLFVTDLGGEEAVAAFFHPSADATAGAPHGGPGSSKDRLTGLPDRQAFNDDLARVLEDGEASGSVAVLLLDLDRFKTINNSMGHDVGDLLLASVAQRLAGVAGEAEMVARFGGDEFLVLFHSPSGQAQAKASAFVGRIREALAGPFEIAGAEVFLDASVGMALNTFGVDDGAELLSNAEAAMYQAKFRGGCSVETFGESMRIEVLDRMSTEHSLHRALERQELMLHYQPVVEIGDTTTVGVEALIRWQHPEQGLVSPYRFIPVAEESGLIIPIGAWVLEQACHQLSHWHQGTEVGGRGSVEVNLSARQIDDPRIVRTVEDILVRTGLPPEHLTLEITESALMKDAGAALGVLRALKEVGVLLAIDDFGTGYSSLSYLQRFPLDILKIDRSFVESLGVNVGDEAIVSAVISLAHALGLRVVAEGVETDEQLEALRSFGCDLAQGFLFSRPLPASEVAATFGLPISA